MKVILDTPIKIETDALGLSIETGTVGTSTSSLECEPLLRTEIFTEWTRQN